MRLFRSLLFQAVLWAILPLLAITAVSVASIYGHQGAVRSVVTDRVARLAHVTAGAVADQVHNKAVLLRGLAETERLQPGAIRALGSSEILDRGFDRGVLLLAADGTVAAAAGDAPAWATAPGIDELRSRAQTEPEAITAFPPRSEEALMLIAVAAGSGQALIAGLSPAGLGIDHLFSDLQLGLRGSGYVADLSGRVIYEQGHPPALAPPLPGLESARAGVSGAVFQEDNGEVWATGYAPVPAPGWAVIVRESYADAVGPMARFAVMSPLLVILAAIVSLVAVYLIVGYVIRPLRRLGQMAERVAWGDYGAVQQPLTGVQETRDLHNTLRHTVEQVRRYQASMQSYVSAVTQGQEEERKRLARELHDDTAQGLVGLIQRIKLARRDLKRDPARAEDRLAELEELATAAWQDVRRFSEDLRPAYLEQFGLEPALATWTDRARTVPGTPDLSFAVQGQSRRLRPEVEVALFRIVQEALNNARQHAGASKIDVVLEYGEHGVTLSVTDDGRGFVPPEFPAALMESGHYGLAGMRERALLVGGRLEIDTAPGRGTRIEVFVP